MPHPRWTSPDPAIGGALACGPWRLLLVCYPDAVAWLWSHEPTGAAWPVTPARC